MVGPRGENSELLRELILIALERHVAWRRRFHPDDTSPTTEAKPHDVDAGRFAERVRRLLDELLSKEELSVPRSSPRYLGQMNADLLLPGLVGSIASMLFNQNSLTSGQPSDCDVERDVIGMLGRMVGFSNEPGGHLCAGGTLSNLYSLWLARSLRTWPLALRFALAHDTSSWLNAQERNLLLSKTAWELWNLPFESEIHRLRNELEVRKRVAQWTIAALGESRFADELGKLFPDEEDSFNTPPLVIVGANRHFSFSKALDLMGLGNAAGRGALVEIPLRSDSTIDTCALSELLDQSVDRQRRVLAVIATLGTTQDGALDDVQQVVAICNRARHRGLALWLHVDACYGGYLATLIRATEGGALQSGGELETWMHKLAIDLGMEAATVTKHLTRDRSEPGWLGWDGFASRVAAMADADSVSVDPHKLGYLPYPASAVLVRDRTHQSVIEYGAQYLWTVPIDSGGDETGRHTLEGSRPRAAAAACWLAHRAVPLSQEGHAKILGASLLATRELYAALENINHQARAVGIALFNRPHTNVICYVPYHRGCRDLQHVDELSKAVAARLCAEQAGGFTVSQTTVRIRPDSDCFGGMLGRGATDADLTALRSVVMGPAGLTARIGPSSEEKGLYEVFAENLVGLTEQSFASL